MTRKRTAVALGRRGALGPGPGPGPVLVVRKDCAVRLLLLLPVLSTSALLVEAIPW